MHHWDPCLDLFTSRSVCVPSQIEHSRFSFHTRSNSTQDTGSFRRSFHKVTFTTAVKKIKKKNVLNDHFHCSHQYPVSGWVMAARCCMRSCFLRTATSAYAIKPLNLLKLDCSFINPVRKRKAEAQEQNNWKGKQSGGLAREAIQNDFLTLVK